MNRLLLLSSSILPLLSGCYSAEGRLLSDDALVAPYATIAYTDQADELHVRHALTRDGNSYVETADDGSVTQRLRLMPVNQDWYVVEATSGDDDSPMPNYAYLHVDTAKGEAEAYASQGDESHVFDGSHLCGSDVCVDDLDAYRAFAENEIRQGVAPDSTYYVTLTE